MIQEIWVSILFVLTKRQQKMFFTVFSFQVFDMKPHEIEWLCQHLGHTSDVHKIHYRNTSSYIERVNLGKLFLIQDHDASRKFAGKDLATVDINGM